jgi:prolipoprotein diacylglyceryltransferase
MTPLSLVAAIPSPPGNSIGLGPLQLRAYGLMIALGALAGLWIAQRRWAARGGDPSDIAAIAGWAIPAGIVGARAYHVLTDLPRFEGRWWHVVAIWEGGLGIPGGIAAGVAAGVWVARRRGLPTLVLLDVVAPALPVAQAIGR